MTGLSDEQDRARFDALYQCHLKHLKLKGLQPKTIEAYSRAVRRAGAYFGYRIEALGEPQLRDYFTELIGSHSWSTVKLDLYGLQFFTQHVLKQPWTAPGLIKPPNTLLRNALPVRFSSRESGTCPDSLSMDQALTCSIHVRTIHGSRPQAVSQQPAKSRIS